MNKLRWLIGVLFVFLSCNKGGELLTNPSSEATGITFSNTLTETDDLNILDYLYFYNGGGVALGDINKDGLVDIFLSGNQVKNKLYLNKGNLQFEDVSESAGVSGNSSWNTGAIMGDVNGDGWLDIYVCAVVGILGFDGYNELFINNGDGTFTEQAEAMGLDLDTYSSNAAFLDYDKDGDLDIYLLNHAVHTQDSFGKASLRNKRNEQTGDKLMRNDGGVFVEVSEEAGIYGGVNSYGLGISIADFNQDGWPDIYIGNDFHEDDYYYINNQDGTFSEKLKDYFGHTSRFSMGNDAADINHDGWPDLISLDMLPEDETVLKSSEGDDNVQIQKLRTQRYGYHYQFTRNMLYINSKGYDYQETALLSGLAATDWSWSALFADFNQDAEQDLFISNGIPKRPNDLDYINFTSSEQIQKKLDNTKLVDQEALNMMPSGSVANYVFEGNGGLKFTDQSQNWIKNDTLVSGASAWADLDNDGDLDLVTNNINTKALVYENKTDNSANYLKLQFNYSELNPYGIGTKVFSYHQGILQYKELYTVRGFQASSEPIVHFGYGTSPRVDSLKVVWPDGQFQTLSDVEVNQTLTITPSELQTFDYNSLQTKKNPLFEKIQDNLGMQFIHEEDAYIDFNRQKLIAYQVSDRGPAVAIGDWNGDGKEDVYFGSSKFKEAQLYVQNDTSFVAYESDYFTKGNVTEEVSAAFFDADRDGTTDLFLGTAGADFYGKAKALQDRYITQSDSLLQGNVLPDIYTNTSVVAPFDFDADGDMDVFIGNQLITNDFGRAPTSYLLKNENGSFESDTSNSFENIGMVTDAIWSDFNADGVADLIIIGEWMTPRFYQNIEGTLSEVNAQQDALNGLWQTIEPFDIDKDGDIDYLLGNWGTNSKFEASTQAPLRLYLNDFDTNGQSETIIAVQKEGAYYPLESVNELTSQLVSLKKKFTNYKDFAGKSMKEIFNKQQLSESTLLEVETLSSGYLKNEEGTFVFVPFEIAMQVAPILSFCTFDFDNDGQDEALAAGNYFGVKPYLGRFDSFQGALIEDEETIRYGYDLGLDFAQKSIRHLNILPFQGQSYLMATFNNQPIQLYKLLK